MIHSMTGFGKAQVRSRYGMVTAETRALNHKFFEVSAKIHNLAHEMVHYFQFYYRLKGDLKNMVSDQEPEAVRVQHFFRVENGTFAARHTLKQPSL